MPNLKILALRKPVPKSEFQYLAVTLVCGANDTGLTRVFLAPDRINPEFGTPKRCNGCVNHWPHGV